MNGGPELFLQVADTGQGISKTIGRRSACGLQEGGVCYPSVSHCRTGLVLSRLPMRLLAMVDAKVRRRENGDACDGRNVLG